MAEKRIDVGVITHEAGAHVETYLSALAATQEVERVWLADPDARWTAAAEKRLGNKWAGHFRQAPDFLQKTRPHLALVTMEAALAPPVIDMALEAGCHVLAEKPACVRVEQFQELAKKAEAKHRHLMLALANRVFPPVQEARRLIRAGELGRLFAVEVFFVADQTRLKNKSYQQSWLASRQRAGGGHLIWLGIHWLDMAMYITGLKPQRVAGFAVNVGGQPVQIEDSAAMAFQLSGQVCGVMLSGYYLDRGYQSHLQVWGEQGWLRLAAAEEMPLEWYQVRTGKVQRYEYAKGQRGYLPFIRAAVRACLGQEAAPITADESLQVLQTIFAFYRAAETGQAVSMAT
ncbi:MAG: Gfo/Idh/MocA family oxidoreductase [Gemmatales bacterium]|nr:Gfo/Idh/MocA family oxidoreductase [Gemmatales bacterium]MDW8222523.1 Gfo/Idh/MocA family oxidoreductase [Gemmatales bacterium]